ncbi:transmembrane protein 234 homolog [Phalaenopsis equestris]|uniref:transmembrane protein 234 homolog n=1 Tax=Phalaenopsis equestris TaxID=78828 RepID=UPI0009E32098|nr:transmembrane protein 234 homolog [Phalaenopsis equestris]
MISDIEKMIGVGLVWGSTNSLMRRGALLWEQKLQSATPPSADRRGVIGHLLKWLDLLFLWQYSVPFLVNLSASAAFFYILGDSPLSVAVPVTNATTFAATAVSAMLLGEEMRVRYALLGIALIVFGVWICITS